MIQRLAGRRGDQKQADHLAVAGLGAVDDLAQLGARAFIVQQDAQFLLGLVLLNFDGAILDVGEALLTRLHARRGRPRVVLASTLLYGGSVVIVAPTAQQRESLLRSARVWRDEFPVPHIQQVWQANFQGKVSAGVVLSAHKRRAIPWQTEPTRPMKAFRQALAPGGGVFCRIRRRLCTLRRSRP